MKNKKLNKIKIRLNKNNFIIKIKGKILINNRVVKSKWHTAKYGDPYSESVLYIYQSKCTQTAVNAHTHTVNTPGAVGSHLCCGAREAVGCSVSCSRAPQSWYWRWRESCTFIPPTDNSCRTWDSNSQPFDYESDSLPLGHNFNAT